MDTNKQRKAAFRMNLSLAWRTILRCVVATAVCLMLYLTTFMAVKLLGAKQIGYQKYFIFDNGSQFLAEECHYAEDGTPQITTYEIESAHAVVDIKEIELYSDLPLAVDIIYRIFIGVIMLGVWFLTVHLVPWEQGDRDRSAQLAGRAAGSDRRGWIIGLLAGVPFCLAYILLVLSKLGLLWDRYFALFKMIHTPLRPVLDSFEGGLTSGVPWWGVALLALTMGVLPSVCALSYWLGRRSIVVMEKLIYRNKNDKRMAKD